MPLVTTARRISVTHRYYFKKTRKIVHFLPDFRLILRVILAIFVGFGAFQKGPMVQNNVIACPIGSKKS